MVVFSRILELYGLRPLLLLVRQHQAAHLGLSHVLSLVETVAMDILVKDYDFLLIPYLKLHDRVRAFV